MRLLVAFLSFFESASFLSTSQPQLENARSSMALAAVAE
jgi:hypothetical protein